MIFLCSVNLPREMDRTWMCEARKTSDYFRGELDKFIMAAEINAAVEKRMVVICPCKKCKNIRVFNINETITIRSHVLMNGFVE
jgi:hypothetical protein